MHRRHFLMYTGKGLMAMPLLQWGFTSCSPKNSGALDPGMEDRVSLIDGLDYQVFLKWGDSISETDYFGYGNNFLAFFPVSEEEGFLWVNHENINTFMVSGYLESADIARHVNQIRQEAYNIGGTFVHIKRENDLWQVVTDPANFRLTATKSMTFAWHEGIQGYQEALGTVAPAGGGVTPWGTILMAECNYQEFFGEYDYEKEAYHPSVLQWERFLSMPTQHYGWIVELNLQTGEARKHVGMGRFAHDAATVAALSDGRVAVYSTDHVAGGCLYKYLADQPGELYPGKLYVADMDRHTWIPIDHEDELMAGHFSSDTEMMIRCREAAHMMGGTPLNRPGSIAIHPSTGELVVACAGDVDQPFGYLITIRERGNSYDAMGFEIASRLEGDEDTFACPESLVFDSAGDLWMSTDIPVASIGKAPYEAMGNNGLYLIRASGESAGIPMRVGTAPVEACFTGLCLSQEGKTLFASVQHPGERSVPERFTSNWPHGKDNFPKPALIAISGAFLDGLQNVV